MIGIVKENNGDITVIENGFTIIRLRFYKGDFLGGSFYKPLDSFFSEKCIRINKLLPENVKISFDPDHRFGGGLIHRDRSKEQIVKAIENHHLGFSATGKITQSKVTFEDGSEEIWILDNSSQYRRDRVAIDEEFHESFIGTSARNLMDAGYKSI
jgi:hypothetical protein